ncbi:hypothetical protein IQ249_08810 [Lusitaniella coriacea LEGE 07157]|uniref:Trypsin-co-occurring domain-containing protein n=1 Tax=Lusitaniella coriacea LEGE 07157 TaxID=945747 RepID=A0A8J7DVW4_9CYAN|nr:CU044_2847 family protein [Lusitaniella coriacea]MBE9115992.1 hypothetical protein [Lusitaniella coriacea LEGE 07157]
MSATQQLFFQADGEVRKLNVETTIIEKTPAEGNYDPYDEERSINITAQMEQAQQLIRNYTDYVLKSFKDFGAAEVQGIKLKFGVKLGGNAGIPYITQGSAESNLAIEVECKFPDNSK